jgi:copper(I)-binding protein
MQNHASLAALAAFTALWGASLFPTAALAGSAASSPPTQAKAIEIEAAWVRWLPGGVPLAGYATLANRSDQPSVLTSVSSAVFRDVSMHQTLQIDGTVRMSPLERIVIDPHTTLEFEARGIHLMLMEPRTTLDPHGQVPITLHFADNSSLTVQLQVRSSTGPPNPP